MWYPDLVHSPVLIVFYLQADQFVKIHDFARAYGSLCWNLSKVIPRKDLPRIHTMCLPLSFLVSSSSATLHSRSAVDHANSRYGGIERKKNGKKDRDGYRDALFCSGDEDSPIKVDGDFREGDTDNHRDRDRDTTNSSASNSIPQISAISAGYRDLEECVPS